MLRYRRILTAFLNTGISRPRRRARSAATGEEDYRPLNYLLPRVRDVHAAAASVYIPPYRYRRGMALSLPMHRPHKQHYASYRARHALFIRRGTVARLIMPLIRRCAS